MHHSRRLAPCPHHFLMQLNHGNRFSVVHEEQLPLPDHCICSPPKARLPSTQGPLNAESDCLSGSCYGKQFHILLIIVDMDLPPECTNSQTVKMNL